MNLFPLGDLCASHVQEVHKDLHVSSLRSAFMMQIISLLGHWLGKDGPSQKSRFLFSWENWKPFQAWDSSSAPSPSRKVLEELGARGLKVEQEK